MNSKKLKSKRVLKGLNQDVIAKSLGITLKTYSFKENGKAEFTREEIYKIADILELNIQEVNSIFFDNKIANCIT